MTKSWFLPAADLAFAPRLFWFPSAGGNASAFLPWQDLLGPDVELRIAQLPGRGTRLFEAPMPDMDEVVAHLTDAVDSLVDRRFAFAGHSLGALLAFEVARSLRRRGRPGPVALWVAGAEGPRTRSVKRRFHDLPTDELIDALREYNGTPAELLDDREMMDLLLPGLRADFALAERYVYRPEAPLDLPIHMLRGDRDPYVEPERTGGWRHETTRPLREYVYDGDHFFIHPHQVAITTMLAATLATDRAEPRRSV